MNNETKHKIVFYNACYYLCGLSNYATAFYRDKRIKITENLDACVYRYLEQDYDFGEAYFNIHFEKNEKHIWGTLIKLNTKKAEKNSSFFSGNHNDKIDYILSTLIYLKPSNSHFAHMPTPQISIEEQNTVIEVSRNMLKEALKSAGDSKTTKKTRKLIKQFWVKYSVFLY